MALVDGASLDDIERRQKVILHELADLAQDRPVGGEYLTIAYHKAEEVLDNVKRAQEKAKA